MTKTNLKACIVHTIHMSINGTVIRTLASLLCVSIHLSSNVDVVSPTIRYRLAISCILCSTQTQKRREQEHQNRQLQTASMHLTKSAHQDTRSTASHRQLQGMCDCVTNLAVRSDN
jgi:hypothetical protein